MESEQVIIFEIQGRFGFFRSPEGTRTTLSFPFTRTSILGFIGSILGRDRNSYWEEDPLNISRIALEFLTPLQQQSLTTNYIQTQTIVNLSKPTSLSFFLPNVSASGGGRGFVTAVKLNVFRDLHYRIYFTSEDLELFNSLEEHLKNSWAYYPPYLGHANFLADFRYISTVKMESIKTKKASISTVVPVSVLNKEEMSPIMSKLSIIFNIPIRTIVSKGEIVDCLTENFLISNNPNELLDVIVNDTCNIYQLRVNGEEKHIIFFPDGRNIQRENIPKLINREEDI
ncbi:MAG: hypothetical protein ACTSR8_10035 [Promethearchaeota archaeon]